MTFSRRQQHRTTPLGDARYTRREILAGGAAALLGSMSSGRARASVPPTRRPNVVIFLADALRADHLQCYGHSVPASPNLLRFSQTAAVFEQCMAAAPWTKPAIASLFTGVCPRLHQMVLEEWSPDFDENQGLRLLNENLTSFDEFYKDAGYDTAWFLANPHVVRDLGFGRGFRHYRYRPGEDPVRQVDEVVRWLKEGAQEPFLLFVHVIDPHDPYLCSSDEYKRLHGKSVEEALAQLHEADRAQLHDFHLLPWSKRIKMTGRLDFKGLSPSGTAYLRSLYDTEIRRVDGQFARVLRSLRDRGVYERTAVMLTSDHGEAFNEHGDYYHGNDLFDNELHVPLVLRLPWMTEARRIPWSVSQCDICPTLLSLIGVPPPAHMQGGSLLSGDGALAVHAHREAFAYLDRFRADPATWDAAMVKGPLKAILRRRPGRVLVFDREADPSESRDLLAKPSGKTPSVLRAAAALRRGDRDNEKLAGQLSAPQYIPPVEGNREALKALGYL